MMNFTALEMNLIHIYKADTRPEVIANLRAARPFMEDDPELLAVADNAIRKLSGMDDAAFSEVAFEPAFPILYTEDDTEGF